MRFRTARTGPLCVLLLSLGLLGATSPAPAQSSPAPAGSDDDPSLSTGSRVFPGILLPARTALIKSPRDERIASVAVQVGDLVKRGQLLIELVADEERVTRERAAAVLEQARDELDRARRLYAENLTSDGTLETAETAYRIARADHELDSLRYAESFIRAPFDGVVAEIRVDPGTSVEMGDNLVRVATRLLLRLEVLLPEEMLPAFTAATVLEVRPSHPDTTLRLPVYARPLVVDPSSGTFMLEIEVPNAAARLIPGVSCQVAVRTASGEAP